MGKLIIEVLKMVKMCKIYQSLVSWDWTKKFVEGPLIWQFLKICPGVAQGDDMMLWID